MAKKPSKKQGGTPKILRIGIFQNHRFIEEQLMHQRKSVSIGSDWGDKKNDFVIPQSKLPKRHEVFSYDEKSKTYTLAFTNDMKGRISTSDGIKKLSDLAKSGGAKKSGNKYHVQLKQRAQGRIAWEGDSVALLFQFVTPPPIRSRPVLPAQMRGNLVSGMADAKVLIAAMVVLAVLKGGFLAYVQLQDWPEPKGLDPVRDIFVKIEPEKVEKEEEKLPPPEFEEKGQPEEAAPAEEAPAPEPEPEPEPEKKSAEERAKEELERKLALEKQVKNKTILAELGGVTSEGGGIVNMLTQGAGKTDMENAFANSKGVMTGVAGVEKSGLYSAGASGSKGTEAGIGSLGAAKGAGQAAKGVKTGGKTEKKVKVKLKIGGKTKTVGGKLDANSISAVIKRRQRKIAACYERAVKKDPTLSGKVVVSFTIGNAGRVTKSKASTDSVGGGVGACVSGAIKKMRFSRPKGGEVLVSKSFVFEVAN
jgi:hypothetical protein